MAGQILFLCTGNYYRSRFAEMWFNHHAQRLGLKWRADSSGLDIPYGSTVNVGPIAQHVVAALKAYELPLPQTFRCPKQLSLKELEASTRIIALKEAEHRPYMRKLFPQWVERVTYWHVDDLDAATPQQAIPLIREKVDQLLQELGQEPAAAK